MPIARGDRGYLDYLHRHARFFILLTVVFGAITGVGIWWTIGLASPLATEMLIRTFVFGWATEWVFFVVEIVAGLHLLLLLGPAWPNGRTSIIGWIYAVGGVDQPGVDYRHHGVHAQPGRMGHRRRVAQLLDGVLQSAVPAADHRPHRRGAAAELALRLSARLADASAMRGCAT